MKIGIIGAGFTGLSAGLDLQKKGHDVTIIEKENFPGGLAAGFKPARQLQGVAGGEKSWDWPLEKYYHHLFTNDRFALNLAEEVNCHVFIKRPITSTYIDNKIYQLDSPYKLLTFSGLPVSQRLRMAAVLGILRYNPFWKPFEKIKASDFLPRAMGKKPYELIWEPQLINKFGGYYKDISLAWFWARINKRTTNLVYPEGGFLEFAKALDKKIRENGGKIIYNSQVQQIENLKKIIIKTKMENSQLVRFEFDKLIVTLPLSIFTKIAKDLPRDYIAKSDNLNELGAITVILRLNNQFLKDGTYWLSICDKKSPIMAIVEHTNFIDKIYYNNEHIVYIGKYLPTNHPYFSMSPEKLLAEYDPYLKKINKEYSKNIIKYHVFKSGFAQPIIPVNYSKLIPPFETPLKNVYLANMQQVYPWDRGTNYAIELGQKIAKLIERE